MEANESKGGSLDMNILYFESNPIDGNKQHLSDTIWSAGDIP